MTADTLTARTTSRATVDYDTYVLRYGARQRGNVLLAVVGVVLTTGALIVLSGPGLVLAVAAGIGLIAAGSVSFVVTFDAHASYARALAVSVSETYDRKAAAPPPATVRPFVASSSNGHTTHTGPLSFTPEVWRNLFDRALANGGAVNRDDVAKPAGIGRDWYHGDGYGRFLGELTRLGFIDARNRLTPAALSWYEQQIALPLAAFPSRSPNDRTNGRTNGMNGLDLVLVGEGE